MVSTVKVTNIDTPDNTGNITFDRPIVGDGSSLTSLPAANLTGTLPAIDGSALTGLPSSYTTTLVRAYPSATTSIPTTTFTQIPFNTETYDVGGDYNTSTYRFVAPVNGYYLAVFEGHFTTQTDGAFIELLFKKNGGGHSTTYRHAGNTTNSGSNNVDIIYLPANQYLECWVYHTAGSTHTFQNGQNTNWFSICRVG